MTALIVLSVYMLLLLGLGLVAKAFFRGTAKDYFVASHSIGPFLLLMSVFGTTMTAFALVGSTGEAYKNGIGTYGKMASWSGLIHSAVFFFIGIRLWAMGRRYGYVTQIQFFRDRFDSTLIGYLLFPALVGLVIPYLLIGILGAGGVVQSITTDPNVSWLASGVPPWITGLVICSIVLSYIFFGGLRAAAWANTFQTLVFMITGVFTVWIISNKLGGPVAATQAVLDNAEQAHKLTREGIPPWQFFSYLFIPLSVGMFPHIFQHWLTAEKASTFKLAIVAHPLCIMIVWVPCVMLGVWATSALGVDGELLVPIEHRPNTELATLVAKLTTPLLSGILAAGILAAIMSSLDSQFFCLGTMFTNDIIMHGKPKDHYSDKQKVAMSRGFIILVVAVTYGLSLLETKQVFRMGVWCFSGFSALFPLVLAALFWKRVTQAGAIACVVLTTAFWAILFVKSDFGSTYLLLTPLKVMPAMVLFFFSAIVLVVVSLFTKPPSREKLRKFFPAREDG